MPEETKRLRGVSIESSAAATTTNLMSYCIIRNRKLNKVAKNDEKISDALEHSRSNKTSSSNKICSNNDSNRNSNSNRSSNSRSKDVNKQREPSHSDQCKLDSLMMMSAQWLSQSSAIVDPIKKDCFRIIDKKDYVSVVKGEANQEDTSLPSSRSPSSSTPSLHYSSAPAPSFLLSTKHQSIPRRTTTTCQQIDNRILNDNPPPEKLTKLNERRDFSGLRLNKCFSLVLALIVLYVSITTQNNNNRKSYNSLNEQKHIISNQKSISSNSLFFYPIIEDFYHSISNLAQDFLIKQAPKIVLAEAQQYKPEWPSKTLQQEIFLLNLEDGYFGCQVNESQDFLQLFELSRLCDGRTECYLGTDELATPLKCNNRERCGSYQNSRGQQENIQCVNGVCLDGLCYCNDGFGGKSCDVPDENECKFRPCDVFAHCTNTMGSYYCSCFPGYDGDGMHCQDINECEIPSLAALCSDNSECCNLPGHFVCKCKPGYQQSSQSQSSLTGAPSGNTSVQCTDIDECLDERACGRGASCENLPGSFRCSCPPGFTGDPSIECTDMDECRNNPCGIGAQCTNVPGGYRCSCAPGFERNPSLPANLFGTVQTTVSLTNLVNNLDENNFVNSSLVSCLDINECLQTTNTGKGAVCGSGAQCINTPGAYFCQCPPNYTGNPKVACLDIDECASHACGPNAQCKNTPGSYKCECKPGYTGNAYLAEGCQDEDECLRKDACGLNAQCFNTLGSFQCSCQSGYSGDPYNKCADIDECMTSNPCGPGAQCINLAGGYKCTCPDKYLARGTPEMGCERAAVDIGCSGDYDCTANAFCFNSTCQCNLGFQINGIECTDIDECLLSQPLAQQQQQQPIKAFTKLNSALSSSSSSSNNSQLNTLCGSEALCQNTEGSYKCDCKIGYEKINPNSPTSKCRDINECDQSQSPCGQNSKCFNTDGSFKCACSDGFIPINQDPVNGCKSPCDGVNCGQHATCKPHGEEAACVCKPGFTFDPNNIKLGCVDINECDTNYGASGLCGQRAICTNVPGSYRCHCPSGFSGDAYRYCEDINECDRRFGVFGQCGEMAICNNTAGSYTCSCAQGYTGDPRTKCLDIDECSIKFGQNGKCGAGAICSNIPGKFTCRCPNGYSGDPYDKCILEQPICSSSADCGLNQICQSGRCHCPFAQTQQQIDGNLQTTTTTTPNNECRHPCDKTECGPHATCQLDNENQALCVCDAGYMAPSDGRSGCIDVNECIQGLTLSGITPISTLTSGRGSIALGSNPTTLSPGAGTNNSHPCGRNALCRNQPGSFDCVCPPGYSGNAYEACSLDVRNQQQQTSPQPPQTTTTTTTLTTTTTAGNAFGNYQQEPRTTTCSEPCNRGYVCSDGQCVKPDSCRDDQDCRSNMACQLVNQVLGFQCVNVCDTNHHVCGPEAKCTSVNHKPICTCNTSAGYSGNPYDLTVGCQQMHSSTSYEEKQNQQQQTSTTTSSFNQQITTLSGKHEQMDIHRTTVGGGQTGGELSTISFEFGAPINQQQPIITTTSTTSSTSGLSQQSNISSMEQLQKQQQASYELHNNKEQQSKRPLNQQPMIAYELPLPTTPILPQFGGVNGFGGPTTTTTTALSQQQQNYSTAQQANEQQKQINQQRIDQSLSSLMPQLTQTTVSNQQQQTSTTLSKQQQQQLMQNLFSTKRKPTQQPSAISNINNNNNNNNQQLNTANRQDVMNDLSQQQQQQQQQPNQQPDQQQLDLQIQNQHHQQQQQDEISQTFNQFSNKSSLMTNYLFTHKQVSCTSDQHCPGNLFCLESTNYSETTNSGSLLKSNEKYCGCPNGYKREANFCYMHRVNCTSSSLCKAREECISSQILQQYYAANSFQQQITATIGSQQFNLGPDEYTGICICPRGYKLTTTGIACIDLNECDEGTPCAVGAICQNKIGSYECVCPPGTIGDPYTKTCEPIIKSECLINSDCPNDRECDQITHKCNSPCHVCGPNAICTATNHQAICLCPPRYTGNAIDLVYGCQEPTTTPQPPPTTTISPTSTVYSHQTTTPPPPPPPPQQQPTTLRPTGSNIAQQTTTAVGIPFTTLLPQTTTTPTTVAPLETTTPELVEFRTIPPSELFVMCLADGIQVEVQLGGFDGIIYVKGHSQDPKCRKLVMSSSANEFVDFKVQFGHCDLIHRDGEAGFVLVIQKHPKLVTYRARAYHVKCVYNTGERTVTLGFNVSMITTSGTIANTGPPPTCLMSITALDGREVTSAEIGQDLLLRVDVQPDSIYGGFARSCEAKTMDDEGEYQYEVTDSNGCATDPSIFSDWKYDQHRKSLVARFNAFKFPSSNNLRFQCNIRVCFGSCPAVNCNGIDAYGKRRKRRQATLDVNNNNLTGIIGGDDMNNNNNYSTNTTTALNTTNANSLGADDLDSPPTDELIVTDAFKEGALREEIMVQSNAILTFDRKEASLPQQRPQVEDIEFVCLPRLGIIMSIVLLTLLALLALAIATTCWCFAKRRRQKRSNGPLPHPVDFPNPLLRSSSSSTLREPIYGP